SRDCAHAADLAVSTRHSRRAVSLRRTFLNPHMAAALRPASPFSWEAPAAGLFCSAAAPSLLTFSRRRTALRACRLHFVARHAAVIVGVETLEHAIAHRAELGARDLLIAVGVEVRTLTALTAIRRRLARLRTFVSGDDAVIVLVHAREGGERTRQEFVA